MKGDNSVEEARNIMIRMWCRWLDDAGCPVPRDAEGAAAVDIEISPQFALDGAEFVKKTRGWDWPSEGRIVIEPGGAFA